MKKFIVSAALVFASLTSFAAVAAPAAALAIVQEEYTEVALADVPKAISDSVTAGGWTISKASVNKAGEYKLEVKSGDKTGTVYYKADGTQIQK